MATEKSSRTALIAMDGSEHAEKAFQWYLENLKREGDYVLIVHGVDHRKGFTYGSVWMPVDGALIAEAFQAEQEKAAVVTQKLKVLLEKAKVQGEVRQVNGDPGHAIIKIAEESNADFIVTGNRGLGTIRRTVMGSVSDFVMHHSHVPVFVCKH